MSIEKQEFGKNKEGQTVTNYKLTNPSGASIEVLDFGAILRAVTVPDREGKLLDVTLGYDDVSGYEKGGCFFGATIGRSGNRIADARFKINGATYQMPVNENTNNLHSGPDGYETRMWKVKETNERENSITLSLKSPDGDQGFPGNFEIFVKYEMSDSNELIIHYMGSCDEDTVANMTNHSYFNLSGQGSGSIEDTFLQIYADSYTPVLDSASIPTGELASVEGTPMDFREGKAIGEEIGAAFAQLEYTGGYDHNYVLNDYEPGIERVVANAFSAQTGITMEVSTDLPGVQFYAGNFVGEQKGKHNAVYGKREGFCLETQYFPDSINQEAFVSPVLKKGEAYNTVTIYRFGTK